MVNIIFRSADGDTTNVSASPGTTVMQAAIESAIEGVDADCGGSMVCGTCHVIADNNTIQMLRAQCELEKELLEYVPNPQDDTYLSCQIVVTDSMEGAVFHVPVTQR